ncbi:hypothetical protein [Algoriphagus sanaruensis]|uniref:Uncharacterized protein n=1 Tax=Algoriphagus sanaruensis TaxID=1727163 RepID=A0A142EM17_9BACT|nr:hypothetical protein [Algoriphagus sanaruensis]AMQ56172.1 hypothetical protein AO498_07080 [Algoriphagus sanaruensis]
MKPNNYSELNIILLLFAALLNSCQSGPSACECVEQYNYWHEDGGLFKLDENKINNCTEKFRDSNANLFPEDLNSAERNVRSECEALNNSEFNIKQAQDENSYIQDKNDFEKKDSISEIHPQNQIKQNSLEHEVTLREKINKFYKSLELPDELNEKQSFEGNVVFDTSEFNTFLISNSIYSKKRISNLTGNYHDRFHIKLLNIDSISFIKDIEIFTTIEYSIYELGTFENREKLTFNYFKDSLKLKRWDDLGLKGMKISQYDGLTEFNSDEFYNILGSVNN